MDAAQRAFLQAYLTLCLEHGYRVSAVLGRRYCPDLGGYLDTLQSSVEPLDAAAADSLRREHAALDR